MSARRKAKKRAMPRPPEPAAKGRSPRRRAWYFALVPLAVLVVGGGVLVRNRWPARALAPVVVADLDGFPEQFRTHLTRYIDRVREAPDQADRHAELGVVYEANRHWAEAQACFRKARRLDQHEVLSQYHLAVVTRHLGDAAGALELYTEATRKFPDFAPAQYGLADLLLESGEIERAVSAFERVIELLPDAAAGYLGVANANLRTRDHTNAAALAEKAVALQPRARYAHYILGLAYRGLGRLDEAERELEAGRDAQKLYLPDEWSLTFPRHTTGRSAAFRLEQARQYLRAGDVQHAAERLEYAREWFPDDVEVLNELGQVYLLLNRPEDARRPLLRAAQINDRDPIIQLNLTECHERLSRFTEALRYARRATELNPAAPEGYVWKGRILMGLGKPAEALSALQTVIGLDPENHDAHMGLGAALVILKRPAEAKSHYQKALAQEPRSLEGRIQLCRVCVQLGEFKEAAAELEVARRIAPQHSQVRAMADQLRIARR
ncbi:MAG: tetratricopeptide repeat protein [Planctomycetota bacterium]|nr:tetratricopeptide repeat protein [Planctomycetota bacterium]